MWFLQGCKSKNACVFIVIAHAFVFDSSFKFLDLLAKIWHLEQSQMLLDIRMEDLSSHFNVIEYLGRAHSLLEITLLYFLLKFIWQTVMFLIRLQGTFLEHMVMKWIEKYYSPFIIQFPYQNFERASLFNQLNFIFLFWIT